ncbi:MAG: flagellar export protein FliJ [Deltaproteobacteria bacterium]|jgi:flagellar FliJ protein|nr:flagellar export protein FliJ [Deltaproteobacteria bacterium]
MGFKFRLEKVLEYRRQLEEQAMLVLARARARRDAEKVRLENLNSEFGLSSAKLSGGAGMHGAERWLMQNYVQALRQDIESSARLLQGLEEEVALCQNALIDKAQERELLDKLKSRQAKRFAEDEKLREQHENDETATIRYKKTAI